MDKGKAKQGTGQDLGGFDWAGIIMVRDCKAFVARVAPSHDPILMDALSTAESRAREALIGMRTIGPRQFSGLQGAPASPSPDYV